MFAMLQAQQRSLAVIDLEGHGISQSEARSLSNRLRSELVQLGKVTVVERNKMESILSEQDFQLSGCTSAECSVEIGQLLGVTTILTGGIGRVGAIYTIDLRMVDVRTGRVTHSVSRNYRGTVEGLLELIKSISVELLGHTRDLGQLFSYGPNYLVTEILDDFLEITIKHIYLKDLIEINRELINNSSSDRLQFETNEAFESRLQKYIEELVILESRDFKLQSKPTNVGRI